MLELLDNIGKFSQACSSLDLVQLVQREHTDDEEYNSTIIVNVDDNPDTDGSYVSIKREKYKRNTFHDGLHYAEGNFRIGGIIECGKYSGDELRAKNKKKGKPTTDADIQKNKEKYVSSSLKFLDIPQTRYTEISDKLESEVQHAPGDRYVILFTRNGMRPIERFRNKFTSMMEDKAGLTTNPGTCQRCGRHAEVRYATCGYNCCTFDKRIFDKTLDGMSYGVCYDCWLNLLHARRYVDKNLTAWWNGSRVLVLPGEFNERVKSIFDACSFGEHPEKSLLTQLRYNESRVFHRMSECNAGIDFVFFKVSNSSWKITHHINAIQSSRFARIAHLQHRYRYKWVKKVDDEYIVNDSEKDLSLKTVVYHLLGNPKQFVGEPAGKSKTKGGLGRDPLGEIFESNLAQGYLNSILHGYAIDRELFFANAMKIYENNFLVDAGCLQNGWIMPLYNEGDEDMAAYTSEDALFEANKTYFNSNAKMAWFFLGRYYSAMIWESNNYHKKNSGSEAGESAKSGNKEYNGSYLEKNFFFGRKYDQETFLYFANQCFDLSVKYGALHKTYLKKLNSRLTECMISDADGLAKISPAEAKFLFAFGMSQWFDIDKKHGGKPVNDETEDDAPDNGENDVDQLNEDSDDE